MSSYALPPDAVGLGGGGPPGAGGPPPSGGGSMADLAAALGAGGGAPPMGDGDPLAALAGGGPGQPGGPGPDSPDTQGSDLLSGMSTTDHIRAAIKHLMMAMTESTDEEETHGITKGMGALQGILAGAQKNQKTISAAGG